MSRNAAAQADIAIDIQRILLRQTANELKAMRRSMPLPEGQQDLVYFISGPNHAVKIGYARNLPKRLAGLQTSSPVPLRVLAVTPGGSRLECEYHRLFAKHRLHGEWFKECREIRAEISRIQREAKRTRKAA